MYIQRNGVIMRDSNHNNWLIVVRSGSVTVLKKLVHTRPTVSARTGLYRNPSPTTAFHTFLSDRRDHARWLSARSITLPPPLQLPPGHSDGEEGEEEEEEEERQEVEELEEEDSHEEEEIVEEEEEEEEEEEGEENVEDEGIGDIEHNDDDRDDENEDEENGEEEEEEEAGRGRRRKRGVVVLNVRPQTCGGGRGSSPSPPSPPLPPGGNSLPPRKAWSARHPSRLPGPYVPPCKRTRQKRDKIQFEADGTATQQGVRTAAHFASAKRTLLDDLDASFLATDRPVTEADINPQFVYVQTLTKGDVFGLAPLVFSDQPSLCLVSNGAECLMIDRRFYLDNCPPPLSRRLKTEVSPYPSEAKLQQDLVNRINWDVYKRVVKRQVWEQSKTRGRPRTS
ncbi:uncharacterized protein LOC143285233 [Babylonia areolata]|uniref:uncharacterized protein LOC143285233 n=1 Tax=Babylonia areolata TaxID=304850 RepID=UPI003FD0B2FA